ncbi:MAG: hypothetical protein RLZZ561_123 [Pseudomonadota bacterium]
MSAQPPFDPISTVIDDHQLDIHVSGDARLTALVATIDSARKSLRLIFYIYAEDMVGYLVRDALVRACARGVSVALVIDGFGSGDLADAFLRPLRDAGARVDRFLPHKGRRYLLRNHQKILIADDQTALIGGANIAADYYQDGPAGAHWHDLMATLTGPQVASLSAYVDALLAWIRSDKQSIRELQHLLMAGSTSNGPICWRMGGPFERLNPYARHLRADLDQARQVDMIQAYFAPDFTFLRRLARVARRGRLLLVTAARSDNTTTVAAARHCYGRLLRGGAEIYEYRPARLHMKLIIADSIVYIGSANYDTRSIFLNVEIMLRVDNAGFADRMRALAQAHLPQCQKIDQHWLKQVSGRFRRLRWFLAYFLFTTIDYTITRRFNIGPNRRVWRLRQPGADKD